MKKVLIFLRGDEFIVYKLSEDKCGTPLCNQYLKISKYMSFNLM
jgi:hypothetical protein